jgi:hypothetical protein
MFMGLGRREPAAGCADLARMARAISVEVYRRLKSGPHGASEAQRCVPLMFGGTRNLERGRSTR